MIKDPNLLSKLNVNDQFKEPMNKFGVDNLPSCRSLIHIAITLIPSLRRESDLCA